MLISLSFIRSFFRKIFASQHNDPLQQDRLSVVGSEPRIFIKDISDVSNVAPLVYASSHIHFLDSRGILSALLGAFHSPTAVRGIQMVLRSADGHKSLGGISVQTAGSRIVALAPNPPIYAVTPEIATACYVRAFVAKSHFVDVLVMGRDGVGKCRIKGLVPRASYQVVCTWFSDPSNGCAAGVVRFIVNETLKFAYKIETPGMQVFQCKAQFGNKGEGLLEIVDESNSCIGNIKVEAFLG